MTAPPTEFDWIEWDDAGPDDLHDSGYRHLMLVGVVRGKRYELHHAADHIQVHGGVNIDVTPSGVKRIMANTGRLRLLFPGFYGSDALFTTTEPTMDASLIAIMSKMGDWDHD